MEKYRKYIGDSQGGPVLLHENVFGTFSYEGITKIFGEALFYAAVRIGTGCKDKFAANEIFAKSFSYRVGSRGRYESSSVASEIRSKGIDLVV